MVETSRRGRSTGCWSWHERLPIWRVRRQSRRRTWRRRCNTGRGWTRD